MKKFARGLVIFIAISHFGCEWIPAPREILQDSVTTTIGFTFGRLMVSMLVSENEK